MSNSIHNLTTSYNLCYYYSGPSHTIWCQDDWTPSWVLMKSFACSLKSLFRPGQFSTQIVLGPLSDLTEWFQSFIWIHISTNTSLWICSFLCPPGMLSSWIYSQPSHTPGKHMTSSMHSVTINWVAEWKDKLNPLSISPWVCTPVPALFTRGPVSEKPHVSVAWFCGLDNGRAAPSLKPFRDWEQPSGALHLPWKQFYQHNSPSLSEKDIRRRTFCFLNYSGLD